MPDLMTVHIVSDNCKTLPPIFIFFATWFRQINIFWAKQNLFSHLAKVASGSANPAGSGFLNLDLHNCYG